MSRAGRSMKRLRRSVGYVEEPGHRGTLNGPLLDHEALNMSVVTCEVVVLVSRSRAVMEPRLWALLPPPSHALWLLAAPSRPSELTVKH